jgi:hypothetical protein
VDSKQNAQLLLHQTGVGETQIQVIMQDETVRLTQRKGPACASEIRE